VKRTIGAGTISKVGRYGWTIFALHSPETGSGGITPEVVQVSTLLVNFGAFAKHERLLLVKGFAVRNISKFM